MRRRGGFGGWTDGDDTAHYVPTQVIADLFKANSYDGVVYLSRLGSGHNITLFDLDVAALVNCFLFQLDRLEFTFSETAQPYFVTKYYERKPEGAMHDKDEADDPGRGG